MKVLEGFPTKILIVDDKPEVRDSLRGVVAVESRLYTVKTAASGSAALEVLNAEEIDVVLCDLILTPAMDGIAVTDAITRKQPGARVVLFTGKDVPDDTKLRALEAGAFSYLSKPINYDELLHGIKTINSIRRTEYLERCFETLARIAYSLQESFDFDVLARRVAYGAHELGYTRARLYLYDEKRQTLVGKAAYGTDLEFEGYEIPVAAQKIISAVFAHDRPTVWTADLIAERFGQPSGESWLADIKLDAVSWIDCPLVVGSKRIGTLAVDHHPLKGREYTREDLQIIGVFAGLAAQALNNSRLYQKEALARASLSSILREAPDAIVTTDLHGTITQVSPSVERVIGYPPSRMIGQHAASFYTDERGSPVAGVKVARALMDEVKSKGMISNRLVHLLGSDGLPRPISISISLLHDKQEPEREIGTLGFLKDLGPLEAQTRRYRDILEGFGYGTLLLDEHGLIEFANRKAERLLRRSRDELQGRWFGTVAAEAQSAELEQRLDAVLREGDETAMDLDVLRPDGVPVPVKVLLTPFRSDETIKGVVVALYGADELTSLIQSGRLMVLGQMVASVAHEINNPLNNILPAARDLFSHLEKRSALTDRGRSYLEMIEKNGERIQRIVQQLREFARPQEFRREPLSLHQVIHDSIAFLETRFKNANIDLVLDLSAPIPMILGEATRLQQVLLNLLVNAEEAMEGQATPKEIRIETSFEPPDRVVLLVSDNGRGVPAEVRDLLFDPFFTTKSPSKGTGLGLSISKSIMDLHGGTIELAERPGGQGACFRLELRACGDDFDVQELRESGE